MNEPYIIEAGDFDPEKQEMPCRTSIGGSCWEWRDAMMASSFPNDSMPIVVRDKQEPKTLEEVVRQALWGDPPHYAGRVEDFVVNALREAFPELRDK